MLKKKLSLLLSILLIATCFTGCDFLQPRFMDYDVSGYVQGLLDSSYHGDHEEFIAFTNSSVEKAQENNDLTVENGAINFCNSFNIFPSDTQLKEIEEVFKEAYEITKYVVKDEVKTDTGYTIEVEMEPLLNIQNETSAIEKAREKASKGELDAQQAQSKNESSDNNDDDDYDNTESNYGDDEDDDETSSASSKTENFAGYVDENTAFVDEVIKILKASLVIPEYGTSQIITLNILMDEEGVLSLDTVQIDEIDRTVILFTPKS